MDDLEFLDVPLVDMADTWTLLLHFAFNALVTWCIIHFLYYPKSRRKDYYFTFILISVSVFFLIFLLGGVKIKVGFALGLFAIFGIIRYRTESMPVREMTYLFVLIALSVINALAVTLSYAELLVTNLIFIVFIRVSEDNRWISHVSCKLVLYDRIDLVLPSRKAELIEDLQRRTGLMVVRVEVGAMDFLRDTAMLKVFYAADGEEANTVNRLMKLPKTTEQ